jgi:hypothetical protein
VAGLALVVPALGELGADTVETGEGGHFAEPATDEDTLELVVLSGSKDLAVGAGVELVPHDAVAVNDDLEGVGLELRRELELLKAELGAPLGDNIHVASSGWLGRRRGRRGGSRSRSRSGLRSGRGSGGRSVGGVGGSRLGSLDLVDRGLSLVDGGGSRGGRALAGGGLRSALGNVDSVKDGLDDNTTVLRGLLNGVSVVGRGGERRASKGGEGESESGTHGYRFRCLGLIWFGQVGLDEY